MTARRVLRVLTEDPRLGKPGDTRDASWPDAQGFVDLGYAEWVVDRANPVETTERSASPEVAVRRPTKRVRATPDIEQR